MSVSAITPEFRGRRQTWQAYKGILRHIHARGLVAGQRLPNQPELRAELGVSNDTLHAAIKAMRLGGIITSRPRIGTVVADTAAIGRVPWTIGITTGRVEDETPFTFYTEFLVRLQAALGRAGCRCLLYHQNSRFYPAASNDYPSLREDVSGGELDGLVVMASWKMADWKWIESLGVPLCHTHSWEEAPSGVIVDQGAMAEQAVALLMSRGCRRLAAAAIVGRDFFGGRFWDGFDRAVAAAGLPASSGVSLGRKLSYARPEDVDRIAPALANELFAFSKEERPDGLVISDDYVASQLSFILRESGDYHPLMAVQTNHQQPREFVLPILSFEVDIQELAQQTADMLLERIRNPETVSRVEWKVPRVTQQISLS